MLYLNGQAITNQAHVEANSVVISKLYTGSTLVYQREITGTSGYLYESTHTVTVPVGVSSITATGYGGAGASAASSMYVNAYGRNSAGDYSGVFGATGYSVTLGYDAGIPVITANSPPASFTIYSGAIFDFVSITNISCKYKARYYPYLSIEIYGANDIPASAGLPTTITCTGIADTVFNGSAIGVTTAPAQTSATLAVNRYVVKTLTVTVPVGGACKLDWV